MYVRERRELPGSPRSLLREAARAEAAPEWGDRVALVATWAGAPARVRDAFARAAERANADDVDAAFVAWSAAAELALDWLRGSDGPATERDLDAALERAVSAAERCGRCGRWWGMENERGETAARLVVDRCNTRACLACTRGRLRKVADRWAPLFAAPVRDGYRVSFVTVGSLGTIADRADVYGYLRRVGRLVGYMREGAPAFGIQPGAWVAGLRALELMPRASGGWSHVHLTVVRAGFYAYGRHLLPGLKSGERALHRPECELVAKGRAEGWRVDDDRWNAWPCSGCGAAPSPADLGFRGLLRHLGMGEVFKDDRVTQGGDGARAVAAYVAKLERYISKVCDGEAAEPGAESGAAVAGRLTWGGRRDILAAMRGARLLQPFGDALGLLAGPDETRLYEHGARIRVVAREPRVYDPTDERTVDVLGVWRDYAGSPVGEIPASDRPDDRKVERVTRYRGDTLQKWARWCDTDALRSGMFVGSTERTAFDSYRRST